MGNKVEILRTPTIKKTEYKNFKTEDKLLGELIEYFTNILRNKLSQKNLLLFYKNISTLKIENKSIFWEVIPNLFKDNAVTGQYYLDDNIISIFPLANKSLLSKYIGIITEEYIANLYHELLHMSSTIVDKKNKIVFSGFSQIGDIGIGIAVDDAYTEILLYRYFGLNKEYMSYDYEVIITSLLEQIITKEKMTNLYFNADLYGLTMELQKYNTKENIIKFLEDLDSIYTLQDHSKKYKKDIIYYHNEIAKFIVDTYLNKLKTYLAEGIITKEEYDIKLDKCINDIHTAFEKLELDIKKTRKK